MIQPKERSTLTEAMTPPAGFTFDAGIATTYSLDIGTLMALPLQLAWLATSDDVSAQKDPIRLLEGLRRTAKRLSVFSDRGHMHIPRIPHALMGLTEEMIHEVSAPHGGAFHPKVWVLRFLPEDARKDPCIRLLILSRNLTDDRSWDLNLCLEGTPKGGIHKENREIAAFVRSLPKWAHKRLPPERQQDIESLADGLHRCKWDYPGAFEEIAFHVVGTGPKPRPLSFPEADEAVIISPFVRDKAVRTIAENVGTPVALVSRSEELELLSEETRSMFGRVDVLHDDADSGSEEELSSAACRGLHAKAVVLRRGWRTSVYVGSANCTTAAMVAGTNVEVMAELTGRHSKVGTPADWLSDKGMGSLLVPFTSSGTDAVQEQRAIEDALERCRKAIIQAGLTLNCERCDDGGYRLELRGTDALAGIGAEVWAWPLTVPSERKVAVSLTPACELGLYAPQDVTSLTGFQVRLAGHELAFGVELPLANPPVDREAGVLALILRNRAAFLRYVTLLLGESSEHQLSPDGEGSGTWLGLSALEDDAPPLFELLVKAFSRDASKLNYVATAVEKLRQAESDSGEELIPPEFLHIWQTIEQARRLERTR